MYFASTSCYASVNPVDIPLLTCLFQNSKGAKHLALLFHC